MQTLIFDIETDGLDATKIHCICAVDENGKEVINAGPGEINSAYDKLLVANTLVGHNILSFDVPTLCRIIDDRIAKIPIKDTLLLSRLALSNEKEHSLEAWGRRLGFPKGKQPESWESWTPEMQEYCMRDVKLNWRVWKELSADPRAVEIEHKFRAIINEQEKNGFAFDEEAAKDLLLRLYDDKDRLDKELKNTFGPVVKKGKLFTPKVNMAKQRYTAGAEVQLITIEDFNPGSRDQISSKLKLKYGWVPEVLTPTSKAKVSQDILQSLAWPEAKLLDEYLTVNKLIGQLSDGDKSWLKSVKNGRIYGSVNTNGAVTGRCTHSRPNMAQIPSTRAFLGKECRSLFKPRQGWTLLGVDADALEMRCLAHYIARWDGGLLADAVDRGRKEDKSDVHSKNADILGIDRETAKTFLYAMIYGAGGLKLSTILGISGKSEAALIRLGSAAKKKLMDGIEGFSHLDEAVKGAAKQRGYIVGLDGRNIPIRSQSAALNSLLQSAGAVVMKQGLINLWDIIGKDHGKTWALCANVHDEWQIELFGDSGEFGEIAVSCLTKAGEDFKMKCPIRGNWKIGNSWAETH